MYDQGIFNELWSQYASLTSSARKIHQLFENKGELIENDHIAFRTFNHFSINIEVMATPFVRMGYRERGVYRFPEKKLHAKHFEHPQFRQYPKIFISELLLEELSYESRILLSPLLKYVSTHELDPNKLVLAGRLWDKPSFEVYNKLREESEYAAWVYVFGFCVNHFTVFTNALQQFDDLQSVNTFLKENGFRLNASGGEIKGSPSQFLEQSSTLADQVEIEFIEGIYAVPSCYYEFARRYEEGNGKLYHGFIAASANKIFESTDASLAQQQDT